MSPVELHGVMCALIVLHGGKRTNLFFSSLEFGHKVQLKKHPGIVAVAVTLLQLTRSIRCGLCARFRRHVNYSNEFAVKILLGNSDSKLVGTSEYDHQVPVPNRKESKAISVALKSDPNHVDANFVRFRMIFLRFLSVIGRE